MTSRRTLIIGFTLVLIGFPGVYLYVITHSALFDFFHVSSLLSQNDSHRQRTINAKEVLGNINTVINRSVTPAVKNTASAVLGASIQDIAPGKGISVISSESGRQIVSNTGVLSVQNQNGDITLTGGNGITIDGLTITNNDRGSTQNIFKNIDVSGQATIIPSSNNDTLLLASGDGLSITTDQVTKKITISQTVTSGLSPLTLVYTDSANHLNSLPVGLSGYLLESTGGNTLPTWTPVSSLVTSSLSLGSITSGTSTQAAFLIGNGSSLGASGNGSINATSLLNSSWTNPGAIGSGTPNIGTFTSLSASGLTISSLSTGIARITSGTVSSGTVNLASGDVTGLLPITSGGTGLTTYTLGDIPYASASGTLGKLGIGANNTVLTVNGTTPTWTNALTLTSLQINGLTGIGTSNPQTMLHVKATTGSILDLEDQTQIRYEFQRDTGGGANLVFHSGIAHMISDGTWELQVSTNNLVKMKETGTGNEIHFDPLNGNIHTNNQTALTLASNNNQNQLVLLSNNNVGIGIAIPQEKLHISQGNLRVGGGSLCVNATDTPCQGSSVGVIYASSTTIQSADVAENYVSSQHLEPGDLVSLEGENNSQAVVKTTRAYQEESIGVVSTKPGIILNSDAIIDAFHPYLYPIALSGRIPVKVSTENGSIKPGDFLTASSQEGVAMKATENGVVIGKALEGYQGPGIGRIMVFANLSGFTPKKQDLPFSGIVNGSVATISAALSVTGKTLLSDLGITGKLDAGLLTINGMDTSASDTATMNTLSGPLKLQSLRLGGLDFLNGKIIIDPDGTTLLKGSITADAYNLSSTSHTIGNAEIPSGATSFTVKTDAVTALSYVFITPQTLTDIPLSVTQKNPHDSFTVAIPKPAGLPIKFNWWVVN